MDNTNKTRFEELKANAGRTPEEEKEMVELSREFQEPKKETKAVKPSARK